MSKLELANRTLAVGLDQVVYLRRRLLFEVKQHQQLILGRGLGKIIEYWQRAWNQGNEYGTAIAGGTAVCCTEDRYGRLPRCRDRVSDVAGSGKIDYALRLLLPGNEQRSKAKCRSCQIMTQVLQQQCWSAVVK